MDFGEFLRRAVAFVAIVIVAVLLGNIIGQLASLLVLVFACWVFAVGLDYAAGLLERRGMGRGMAILVVLVALLLVVVLSIAIILPAFALQIVDLVEGLPAAIESIVQTYDDLRSEYDLLAQILPEFTVEDYQNLLDASFNEVIPENSELPAINLNALLGSALPVLGGIGSFFGSLLANLFLITFITLYLLADPLVYYRAVIAIVPQSREQRALDIINEIRRAIVTWIGALSVSILFVGSMTTLALGVVLQVPNAVALGVIAGLSSFIPNLGYYIALFPILIFTAAHDPILVIPAFVMYVLINETDGKIIQPRIVQSTLAIPAGVVLPFQIISASLFGFFGIMLAMPILAIVIILVRELYVVELLGKRQTVSKVVEGPDGKLVLEKSGSGNETLPPEMPASPAPAATD
jgi:predicted PurR-regulated permease PerM